MCILIEILYIDIAIDTIYIKYQLKCSLYCPESKLIILWKELEPYFL